MFSPYGEAQNQFYLKVTLSRNKQKNFPTGRPTTCSHHSVVVVIGKEANLVSVQCA
jgi:hypothetical protein